MNNLESINERGVSRRDINWQGVDWQDIDWRALWIKREQRRNVPDSADKWNIRADEHAQRSSLSTYAQTFLEYLAIEPGQSVLDVGCGWGTLAIPLAQAGHDVIAIDFAQRMLEVVETRMQTEHVAGITTRLLNWNDDWAAAGIAEKSVDVAIASRSTIVFDMWEALEKLDRTARNRVAITTATEFTPRMFKPLGKPSDDQDFFIPDHIYCINMLLRMGVYPELRYIDSIKPDTDGTMRLTRWAWISWKPLHDGA